MKKQKLIIGITAYQSIALIHGQLKFLSNEFEVFLLAPNHESVKLFCKKENATHLPVKIERNPSPFRDLLTLFSLIRIFIKTKPDVVNLGTLKISFLGMIAARVAGVKKRVYTCRGFRFEHESGLKKAYLIFFEKIIATLSTQVVCISKSVADLGQKKSIFGPDKIIQFGNGSSNGLDINIFNQNNIEKDIVTNLTLHYELKNKFVYGYVGRLVDRKGINELYQAFDALYASNNQVCLLVVGSFFEDQIADKSIITKYTSHPGIIFTGAQPINLVPTYMSLMDLFVLPAWWEGFGNVLIQAAALGLPVLSTDSTGCKDAVKDGFNGKLIKPKSVDELKFWMNELRENETLRNQYAQNANAWAKNFDSKIIWSAMLKFYKSILN